jgi:hypothetical protein
MERHLRSIRDKEAYDEGEVLSKSFVQDRNRRIAFLRADLFDAKKAANRMVSHLKTKREIFGRHKLVKRITLDDLDDECIALLRSGSQQILPSRDASGRVVVLSQPKVFFSLDPAYKDPFSTSTKCFWYLMMSITEDEYSQKKWIRLYILWPRQRIRPK